MGVLGIGGVFFRAKDPNALNEWYRDQLNVGAGCNPDAAGPVDQWSWTTIGGPTVFAPFKADTDYFPADKQYMLNLRVSGIEALLSALRLNGVTVETKAEWDSPDTGKFARIHDPEGNPIELWEPPA